jgi:hypothetical protein
MLWHFCDFFLCIYPLLYTAGMCDVTFIEYTTLIYTANVFCPRCTTIWFASRHHSQHYSLCLVTQAQTPMPLLEAVRYAQTNVTLPAEIQRAPCLLVQWKHAAPPLFFFGRPVLWMLYFHSTMLGRIWTWSTPWSATSCHIFFLQMDNQFVIKNFREIFVHHFAATWLVYKKCV